MAYRTSSGRGGKHSEVKDNFASLVFGDSRKSTEYERVFSRTAFKQYLSSNVSCGPGIPCGWKGCTAGRAFLYAHARHFFERWAIGGSRHQLRRGATGVIGAFPETTVSGGRGAHSSVACPTNS